MRTARYAVAMLLVFIAGCTPTKDDIYNALPAVGAAIPEFRYPSVDGTVVTPASLRGQPAVIALWSTTCSASRLALASLGALDKEYRARGARVVILADDQDRTAVVTTLARAGVSTPVAIGSRTLIDTFTHGQSALPWRKAFALPTFLVLDRTGRVVFRQIGIERDPSHQLQDVRAALDRLVRERTPPV